LSSFHVVHRSGDVGRAPEKNARELHVVGLDPLLSWVWPDLRGKNFAYLGWGCSLGLAGTLWGYVGKVSLLGAQLGCFFPCLIFFKLTILTLQSKK
jgi:hypothetical protein